MIDKSDVEDLAKLAQLELKEEEKAQFARELNDVVDYINQILQVDTEGVEPTYYPQPRENVLREDKVTNQENREQMMEEAPDSIKGQYRVPGIGQQE